MNTLTLCEALLKTIDWPTHGELSKNSSIEQSFTSLEESLIRKLFFLLSTHHHEVQNLYDVIHIHLF